MVSFIAAIISRIVSVRLVPSVEIWIVPLVQPLLIPIFPAVIPVVESSVELDKRFLSVWFWPLLMSFMDFAKVEAN